MNIEKQLNGWFKFHKYSSYKVKREEFENKLDEFGTFKVYDNFEQFLLDNDYLLEDQDGDIMTVNDFISNSFTEYMDNSIMVNNFNTLDFYNKDKPFIFGEARANSETYHHFASLEHIASKRDLLGFINDVLKDLGEVTHATGTRNEYEVVDFA